LGAQAADATVATGTEQPASPAITTGTAGTAVRSQSQTTGATGTAVAEQQSTGPTGTTATGGSRAVRGHAADAADAAGAEQPGRPTGAPAVTRRPGATGPAVAHQEATGPTAKPRPRCRTGAVADQRTTEKVLKRCVDGVEPPLQRPNRAVSTRGTDGDCGIPALTTSTRGSKEHGLPTGAATTAGSAGAAPAGPAGATVTEQLARRAAGTTDPAGTQLARSPDAADPAVAQPPGAATGTTNPAGTRGTRPTDPTGPAIGEQQPRVAAGAPSAAGRATVKY